MWNDPRKKEWLEFGQGQYWCFWSFIVIIALLSYSMVGGDSPRDEEADIPMGPVQVVR